MIRLRPLFALAAVVAVSVPAAHAQFASSNVSLTPPAKPLTVASLDGAAGGNPLVLDDGSAENSIGLQAGGEFIWFNRFTPPAGDFPLDVQTADVYFTSTDSGIPVGTLYDVYVYSDPDGNPANGADYIGGETGQVVTELDRFLTTAFSSQLTVSIPGDVLIAVVSRSNTQAGVFPAAIDQTFSSLRSWIGVNTGPIDAPPELPTTGAFGVVDDFGLGGNWLVRGSYVLFSVPGPGLTVSARAIEFGSIPINSTQSRSITLRNNGRENTTVSSAAVTGAPSITVDLTGTSLTLAPGDTTSLTLRFTPTVTGDVSGVLVVTSNAASSPATVSLMGSGNDLTQATFCLGAPVAVNDNGPASPYPAAITVSGITDPVFDVDVRFVRLTHRFPADIDAFVQHPLGLTAYVMSDAGGGGDVVGVDLTFDDEAAGPVPSPIVPGTYLPTGSTGTFPAPAPPPTGTSLTSFEGIDANGTWRLFVVDDTRFDAGTLADVCLDIKTNRIVAGEPDPEAGRAALTVGPNPARGESQVRLVAATAQDMTVAVFDVTGRRVAVLFEGAVAAGQPLDLRLDASSLPAGVYVVRATGAEIALARRVTVVR